MAIVPFPYGALLTSDALNELVTAVNALTDGSWTAGPVTSVGTGLSLAGDQLSCTVINLWNTDEVVGVGDGLDITSSILIAAWQAGTVTALGSGLSLAAGELSTTGFVGREGAAVLQLAGGGSVLANGTYYVTLKAVVPFVIGSLSYRTGAGSFTADVKIGATSVTSLSAVNVTSSTITTTDATAANTVAVDDVVTIVISGVTGSPTDVALQLNFIYT